MIPNEVARAAVKAAKESFGGEAPRGMRAAIHAALEAATPFIRAQALEDAAEAIEALRPEMGPGINITQYREGRNDAFVRAADVCTALAATERGQG